MTPEMVLQLGRNALEMTLILAGPVLLFGLIAGLTVAVFQALTQINEMTLIFIPKIARDRAGDRALRAVDAAEADQLHDGAVRGDSRGDAVNGIEALLDAGAHHRRSCWCWRASSAWRCWRRCSARAWCRRACASRVVVFLAVAMLPALASAGPAPELSRSTVALLLALSAETAIGLLLGLVAQFVFGAVQMAGELAGMQMGLGLASLIDPQSHDRVVVLAQWQSALALLLFLAVDGHHMLIQAVAESFRRVPPGAVGLSAAGFGMTVVVRRR